MSIELAHAYVSLSVSTGGMRGDVQKALAGIESDASRSGKSMGQKISSSMGGVLKKSAIGVGVAAGGALAAGLTKGVSRLSAIEGAQAKLKGLGNSASQVGGIMENALASVKGTAFGLEEAGTVAASLVASGIKPGRELEQVLRTTADTAAIAGVSMRDMGSIFGKVAATGKLQGDELMQLSDNGIPALALLSQHLGKTSAEVSDMVSKGQIDFATFSEAMRSGMGGAALEMGNTTSGAFKNMTAAAGRLGATLAGPFFTQAGGAFRGITQLLDGMDSAMKPVMADFERWLTGTGVPVLRELGESAADAFQRFASSDLASESVSRLGGVLSSLESTAGEVSPSLVRIGSSLSEASASLGVSGWRVFLTTLEVAGAAASALAPPLEVVADLMEAHPSMVTAAVAAWLGFKTVPGMLSRVAGAVAPAQAKIQALTTSTAGSRAALSGMGSDFSRLRPQIGATGAAMTVLGQRSTTIRQMQNAFIGANSAASGFAGALRAGVQPALRGIRSAASTAIGAMGGPSGAAFLGVTAALSAMAAASATADRQQQVQASSARGLAEASHELASALSAASGAMDTEVSAAMVANIDAARSSMEQVGATQSGTFDKVGAALQDLTVAGRAYQLVTGDLQVSSLRQMVAMDGGAKAADAAASALDSLGMTNEQLSSQVYGSQSAWDGLQSRLQGMGEGGQMAAAKLGELRRAFLDQQAAIGRIGIQYAQMDAALEVLGNSASSAEDRLSAMRSVLEGLGLVQTTTAQATMELSEAVTAVAEAAQSTTFSVDEFGRAFTNADGTLNTMNTNTHQLATTLSTARDKLIQVGNSGGDVQAAFAQMQPELEASRAAFEAAGLDYDKVLAQFGLTPESIQTQIKIQGLDQATKDLVDVNAKLQSIPTGTTTSVMIHSEEAKQKLEALGVKVHEWNQTTGEARVSVDSQDALARLDAVAGKVTAVNSASAHPAVGVSDQATPAIANISGSLAGLSLMTAMPTINANGGPAAVKIQETAIGVEQLNALVGGPTITANNQPAANAVGQTQTWVGSVNGMLGVATTDANNQPALGAVTSTQGAIDSVNGMSGTGTLNADNSQVKPAVDTAQGWIFGLQGKTVSVVFRAIYEGFKSGLGLGGAKSGGFIDRLPLPAYAKGHSGYQLPTSGPGTEVEDGFLAFDSNMVPAARLDAGEWVINQRSSRRYNRELAAINAGVFPKLPGYADGARHDAQELKDFLWGRDGKMPGPLQGYIYDWGNRRNPNGWGDCSGTQSIIAGFLTGEWDSETPRRLFSTADEGSVLAKMGFQRGRWSEGSFGVGWYNGGPYGGHTAGTLPDGTNVEMGGGAGGNGKIGGAAAGANDAQFTDRMYLPVFRWQLAGVEGLDALTPPEIDGTPVSSRTSGAASKLNDSPTTWSGFVGKAAETLASSATSDLLGFFGIPDQIPPILSAWKAMNEAPDFGGPTDWDLSVAAAKVKKLDGQIGIHEHLIREGENALSALKNSPLGDPRVLDVINAQKRLDGLKRELEKMRREHEAAKARLDELLDERLEAAENSGLAGSEKAQFGVTKARNDIPDKEESIRKAKRSLQEAEHPEKGKADPEKVADARGRLAKAERDLEGAKTKLRLAEKKEAEAKAKAASKVGVREVPDSWAGVVAGSRARRREGFDLVSAGGYWGGGPIPFGSGVRDDVPLVAAQGEFIVNRQAAAQNRALLEQINSGRQVTNNSTGATINMYAVNVDDAVRQLRLMEAQAAQTFVGAR